MPTLPFVEHSIERPSQSKYIAKRIKGIQIGKEELKLPVSSDNVLYIGKPRDCIKKLLE